MATETFFQAEPVLANWAKPVEQWHQTHSAALERQHRLRRVVSFTESAYAPP